MSARAAARLPTRRPAAAVAILAATLTAGTLLLAQPAPPRLQPADSEMTLDHSDRRRRYIAHLPPRPSAAPLPLLLAFHRGGGHAAGFQCYAGLDAAADREGFIVVYPNGSGRLPDRLLTWNAGNHCCGFGRDRGIDDVAFAAAVIGDLERRTAIDRRRIYATGHSNGAMMAYRLAAERADLVAAVVPVAGAMSLDRFAPSRPVPVMHVHSVDDPRALYDGGLGPAFPGTSHRVEHAPVEAGLGPWIAHNGCAREAQIAETRRGRSDTASAGHTASRLVYRPCSSGADVVLWKLTGAGHGWPGGRSGTPERLIGPHTTVIDAAEEIWAFVSRFTR